MCWQVRMGPGARPFGRTRRGLRSGGVGAARYLPPVCVRPNAGFGEGPSGRQALQAATGANCPTETEGGGLFCLLLTKIVSSPTDASEAPPLGRSLAGTALQEPVL